MKEDWISLVMRGGFDITLGLMESGKDKSYAKEHDVDGWFSDDIG